MTPIEKKIATFDQPAERGEVYGFSQAVRVGDHVYVSGQTSSDPTASMEDQMREAYASIEAALEQLGASLSNVVDETLFVTDMDAATACAARVRSEVFGGRFELASTLIGTTRLGAPDLKIEIKCTARI